MGAMSQQPKPDGATVERFRAVMLPHLDAAYGFARWLTRDPVVAQDVAQEAMLRALRYFHAFRGEEARPWLLRITVNVCRQWRRGGFGARKRLTARLPDEWDESPALLGEDPGERVASLDLRRAINSLNEEMRIAVVLRYYGGMDASEIGATLGVPATTIRTRLRRALLLLRKRLGDPGELPAFRRPGTEEVG